MEFFPLSPGYLNLGWVRLILEQRSTKGLEQLKYMPRKDGTPAGVRHEEMGDGGGVGFLKFHLIKIFSNRILPIIFAAIQPHRSLDSLNTGF